jgi:hypothetical protein
MRRLEKLEKEKRCKLQAEERAASKREKEYWKKVKRDGWGNKLHKFIKSNSNQATTPVRTPYNLVVPQVYRYNQRIAMLRVKFKKEGKDPRLVAPAVTVEPYMRDVEGLHPLHHSPWFMTSAQPSTQGRYFTSIHVDQVPNDQGRTCPMQRRRPTSRYFTPTPWAPAPGSTNLAAASWGLSRLLWDPTLP